VATPHIDPDPDPDPDLDLKAGNKFHLNTSIVSLKTVASETLQEEEKSFLSLSICAGKILNYETEERKEFIEDS